MSQQGTQRMTGGSEVVNGGTGSDGVTSYASATSLWAADVDGHGAGVATEVAIDSKGGVVVQFSSGNHLELGRVALARFADEGALGTATDGSFRETPQSGPPAFGVALAPGFGFLQ